MTATTARLEREARLDEAVRRAGGQATACIKQWSFGIIGREYSAYSRLPLLPSLPSCIISDTTHQTRADSCWLPYETTLEKRMI